jgi:TolA-binding protein
VRLARAGTALVVLAALAPAAERSRAQQAGRVASAGPDAGASARRPPKELADAHAYLDARRYEFAAELYEKYLRTNPAPADAADARFGLAKATLFLNRFDEARRNFELFLNAAPDHPNAPEAMFRLGESAYLGRDLPAARRALEAFVGRFPAHSRADTAWPYLGDVRMGLGDLPGAREAYERALKDYPDGPLADRARYYLARVLDSQGEPDAALATLGPLLARADSPFAARARLLAGQAEAGAGRLEEAVAAFEALERAEPDGPLAAEARLRRARALIGLERAGEAEPILAALAADAKAPALATQAAYELGGLRLDAGQPESALATFDAALAKADGTPLAPMLLYRSAEAQAKLGRADDARARFLRVVREFPRDAWADRALLAAARLALESRDAEAARNLAAQLPARYPGSPLRDDARLVEARALRALGRPAEAVDALRGLLDDPSRLAPELAAAARYDLSLAYKAAGEPEKAAEVLAPLASSGAATPAAANARFTLGQARFDAGQLAEAVGPLREFVDAAPESDLAPHALAYLAVAEHELGHAEGEQSALDQLARDWPESDDLVRVRVRLGEAALEAKDPARAAELLRPVAEGPAGPFAPRARSGLGWALVDLDRPAEAAAAFASAVEADPRGPLAAEAAFMRAWGLEKAGEADAALAAYAEADALDPRGVQAARARLARARLLARLDRPGEAASAFDEVLRSGLEDDAERPAILAERAWALRDAGRLDDARAAFDALLSDHPDRPEAAAARLDLARLAFDSGDLAEVERLLGPLAEPDAEALYLLARARFDRASALAAGDPARAAALASAREAFARLADRFPGSELRDRARFYAAESAFQSDDPAAAEPEFAALAEGAEAPDAEPWRATAWLRRAQCLLALKRWDDVLAQADALLAALPEFPQRAEVHYARGRALQSRPAPRFDDARDAYQAAIDAAPATEVAARAQFMRGETYFFERSYRDAEREFLAVALTYAFPKWQAAALLEAGKSAEADGRAPDARADYQDLIKQFPDDPGAATARERLEALGG